MPKTDHSKQAYATDDPAALAAYRTAKTGRDEFNRRLHADAAALGHNLGPMWRRQIKGVGMEIVGLRPDASRRAPAGWHLVERGRRLAPAGSPARRWLVEHQPTADIDPLAVLLERGLVARSRDEHGGSFTIFRPVLFEWDGRLWACYKGAPLADDDNDLAEPAGTPAGLTWPRVALEDCLVALARAEAVAAAAN